MTSVKPRRRFLTLSILCAAVTLVLIIILVPVLVTQLRKKTPSTNNAAAVSTPATTTSSTTTASTSSAPTATSSPVTVKNLPPNAKFDYQIGGSYQPDADVQVVSRDRTSEPVAGLYNICYINAFQSQPDAADWWKSEGRDELLLRKKNGDYFGDDAWAGEIFLDTRTADKRTKLAEIINGWIDECAAKGFNAIEPDNLDTYTRADGLLKRENNLALAKLFTDYAHSVGIAVGQKNTAELEDSGRKDVGFDFAIIESCQVYDECEMYTDYYGDKALEIEYTDEDNFNANFKKACNARGKNISVILRDRMVTAKDLKDYHYEEC